jgi:DNA-binding transcriptional regulator GbsR (MarR family)
VNRQTKWFVEEMGRAVGQDGLTRIAGRIFAYLLLSEAPVSLDMLSEELGVSKASVSTEARRLETRGVLVRARKTGDRRDYYTVGNDFHARRLEQAIGRWGRMREVLDQAPERLPHITPEVRARLDYMEAVHDFVTERAEQALELWAKKQKR